MSRSARNWLLLIVIVAAVLVTDQVTKRLVMERLQLGETYEPIPALSSFFQITLSHNTGAAFGFLPQAGDLFLITAVLVLAAMFYYYPRLAENANVQRVGAGLICGGALGNALDRIQYGLVIDFIHYQIPNVISNVSNIADHAIVIGVILIFVDSWLKERAEKNAVPALSQDDPSPVSRD